MKTKNLVEVLPRDSQRTLPLDSTLKTAAMVAIGNGGRFVFGAIGSGQTSRKRLGVFASSLSS